MLFFVHVRSHGGAASYWSLGSNFTFDFMWCLQPEHKLLVCSREFASVTWMATLGFPGCFYMNFEYFYICLFLWLQLWVSKFHCWFSFSKYFCLIWMKLLFFYLVSVLCPISALGSNGHKLPPPHYLLLICCVLHLLYIVHTSPLFVVVSSSSSFFFFETVWLCGLAYYENHVA